MASHACQGLGHDSKMNLKKLRSENLQVWVCLLTFFHGERLMAHGAVRKLAVLARKQGKFDVLHQAGGGGRQEQVL